jgi:hypothetical protein
MASEHANTNTKQASSDQQYHSHPPHCPKWTRRGHEGGVCLSCGRLRGAARRIAEPSAQTRSKERGDCAHEKRKNMGEPQSPGRFTNADALCMGRPTWATLAKGQPWHLSAEGGTIPNELGEVNTMEVLAQLRDGGPAVKNSVRVQVELSTHRELVWHCAASCVLA